MQGGEEKTVILGGDEEPRSEATTATNGRVTPQTIVYQIMNNNQRKQIFLRPRRSEASLKKRSEATPIFEILLT